MIYLDEGHKWWSYFYFWADVMLGSSMSLMRWLTGKVYLVLGVGYIGSCQIFGWQYLLNHAQHKGASLQGRHPHITGVWPGCKKIEMMCMHQFDGRQFLHPILHPVPLWRAGVSPVWQSDGCQILLLILCPGPIFGMLIQQALCLWLGQQRWLIRASFCGWLAALLAMVLDGLRGDWGTAKALLAHKA